MNFATPWRMLPPAGAPLTAGVLLAALASSFRHRSRKQEKLHSALSEHFGMRYVRFADTGRSALSLTLTALSRIRPERDEVLIPAYVSFSVPSAVVNAGFRVRLYDVHPEDLTPDYETMRQASSKNTLAVIVCHQFGLPFDPEPAAAICQNCGAALIDDAAQAMGGKIGGAYAGCLGDVGMFSLSRGKPLTAVNGGILLTNNGDIAQAIDESAENAENSAKRTKLFDDMANIAKAAALLVLRRPAVYRLPASLPWLNIGASLFYPSFQRGPMSGFCMDLALAALRLLDTANASRAWAAKRYCRELAAIPFVRAVPPQPGTTPVYLRFPILPQFDGAKRFRNLMRRNGGVRARKLGISPGFPLPLNAIPNLRPHLVEPERSFPGAALLAENLLTLPTHGQVRAKDINAIVNALADESGEIHA